MAEGRRLSEQEKIGNLYHTQSLEYLYKGRDCLILALQFENDDDQNRQKQTIEMKSIENRRCTELDGNMKMQLPHEVFQPLLQLISPTEAVRRTRIFQQIYSSLEQPDKVQTQTPTPLPEPPVGPVASSSPTPTNEEPQQEVLPLEPAICVPVNVATNEIGTQTVEIIEEGDEAQTQPSDSKQQEQQEEPIVEDISKLTLEERLARLESTLPPRPKTGKQRERDIRHGLDKLGVYLPDSSPIPEAVPISEEDEVQNIINQATDEAKFYKNQQGNEKNSVESILRKSAIRIDMSQFGDDFNFDEYDGQEDVHDLLNRAGMLQDEAHKSTKKDDGSVVENMETIKSNVKSAKDDNLNKTVVDDENKQVQELIESVKKLSEAKKCEDGNKTDGIIVEEETKEMNVTVDSTIDENDIKNRNFVEKVENLQVAADNLIHEVKNNSDNVPAGPTNKPIGNSNEESTKNAAAYKKKEFEPPSKSEVMEHNLKLLSDTHDLIDKASNYLEDIIIENEEHFESDSESDPKSNEKLIEMHAKGKASLSEAIKHLQKVVDTWP